MKVNFYVVLVAWTTSANLSVNIKRFYFYDKKTATDFKNRILKRLNDKILEYSIQNIIIHHKNTVDLDELVTDFMIDMEMLKNESK